MPKIETPEAFWMPTAGEWLDAGHEEELVEALRELITELIGWQVEAA